jgi:hypothetical protein
MKRRQNSVFFVSIDCKDGYRGTASFTNCLAKAAYNSFQAGEIDDIQPSS